MAGDDCQPGTSTPDCPSFRPITNQVCPVDVIVLVLLKIKVHYCDVIMSAMAFQITGVLIVSSAVCSGAYQRKHQSLTSLAFVRGINRWTMDSHTGPVTRKLFPFGDVIMILEFVSHKIQWNGAGTWIFGGSMTGHLQKCRLLTLTISLAMQIPWKVIFSYFTYWPPNRYNRLCTPLQNSCWDMW